MKDYAKLGAALLVVVVVVATCRFGPTAGAPVMTPAVPTPLAGSPTLEGAEPTGPATVSIATAVPTLQGAEPTVIAAQTPIPAPSGPLPRFGINYVYHGWKQAQRQGVTADAYFRQQDQKLANLGVAWVRSAGQGDPTSLHWPVVEPERGVFDFALHDRRVQVAAEYDLWLLGHVDWSGVPAYAQVSGKYFDDTCYLEYLAAIVERYDGDGLDDMPGLVRPITYWEIGNEVVVTRKFRGTPQDYAHVLEISYGHIKSHCPACQVVIGGWIIGKRDEAKWQQSVDYLDQVLAAGGGRYFDIMNYHEYTPDGDFLTYYHVSGFRDLLGRYGLDKPIWITEGNTPLSPRGEPIATLEQQAQDIVKRIVIAFDAGVDVYFWHGLDDISDGPGSGLYDAGGALKPNGHNLKLLIDHIGGFEQIERLDLGNDDLYVYRFTRAGGSTLVVWTEGEDTTVDLTSYTAGPRVHLTRALVAAGVTTAAVETAQTGRVPVTRTPVFIVVQ